MAENQPPQNDPPEDEPPRNPEDDPTHRYYIPPGASKKERNKIAARKSKQQKPHLKWAAPCKTCRPGANCRN